MTSPLPQPSAVTPLGAAEANLHGAPQQLTAHRRSLGALTGLRFFAAFYVVLFHSRIAQSMRDAGHAAAGNFFHAGHLAVTLFFILSGFILAYTYQGQIETRGDHIRFWQARFARIWPAYVVSLAASSIPSGVVPALLPALATLCMVQAWDPWHPDLAGTWNLVCWTLSAEAFFYLLFPAAQVRLERLSARSLLLTTAALLSVCALANTGVRGLGYDNHGLLLRWTPLPVIHLPEFLVGVCLGNLFLARVRSTPAITPARGLWTWLALAASLALLCLPECALSSLVITAFAALVYALAAETTLVSRLLSTPLLLLGGGISYAIYLMQVPVKGWVTTASEHFHLGNSWMRLSLTALVLILVSWLIFVAVENPARRVIRSAFAALDNRKGLLPQRN